MLAKFCLSFSEDEIEDISNIRRSQNEKIINETGGKSASEAIRKLYKDYSNLILHEESQSENLKYQVQVE